MTKDRTVLLGWHGMRGTYRYSGYVVSRVAKTGRVGTNGGGFFIGNMLHYRVILHVLVFLY